MDSRRKTDRFPGRNNPTQPVYHPVDGVDVSSIEAQIPSRSADCTQDDRARTRAGTNTPSVRTFRELPGCGWRGRLGRGRLGRCVPYQTIASCCWNLVRRYCERIKKRSPPGVYRTGCDSFGGAKGIRTPDPHTASVVRYQLRHSPVCISLRSPLGDRPDLSYTTAAAASKSTPPHPSTAGTEKLSLGATPEMHRAPSLLPTGGAARTVELPGIEPGSSAASAGLLRAQSAVVSTRISPWRGHLGDDDPSHCLLSRPIP